MGNQWYEQKKAEALHDIGVAIQLTSVRTCEKKKGMHYHKQFPKA